MTPGSAVFFPWISSVSVNAASRGLCVCVCVSVCVMCQTEDTLTVSFTNTLVNVAAKAYQILDLNVETFQLSHRNVFPKVKHVHLQFMTALGPRR